MSAVSDILNRKGSKALTQILIFLVSFVLALLVGGVLLLLQGHDNVFSVYYYPVSYTHLTLPTKLEV